VHNPKKGDFLKIALYLTLSRINVMSSHGLIYSFSYEKNKIQETVEKASNQGNSCLL
jgi:hypothetical protein